jgi:predicted dienelactone hydrolase
MPHLQMKDGLGPFPLVLFSHGEFGGRRVASFIHTHLASHGFVVMSWDCQGDTAQDLVHDTIAHFQNEPKRLRPGWGLEDRLADFAFLHERALAGAAGILRSFLDVTLVGAMGHGIGATAAIAFARARPDIAACLALAPNLGHAPLYNPSVAQLVAQDVTRSVPIFYICAKQDTFQPFDDRTREYFKSHIATAQSFAPPPLTKLVAMDKAGFFHFLSDPKPSHDLLRTPQWPVLLAQGIRGDGSKFLYDYQV